MLDDGNELHLLQLASKSAWNKHFLSIGHQLQSLRLLSIVTSRHDSLVLSDSHCASLLHVETDVASHLAVDRHAVQ